MISSFASYAIEKRISKNPAEFGTGAIQGLAGHEAANNAGAQTSFISLLTLGIPSTAIIAPMPGAMLIPGNKPAPQVMTKTTIRLWDLVGSQLGGQDLPIGSRTVGERVGRHGES